MDFYRLSERASYIGTFSIMCRDMKPANVLISGGEMKIADFGFAKKNVTRKMKNESAVGTPLYMSL